MAINVDDGRVESVKISQVFICDDNSRFVRNCFDHSDESLHIRDLLVINRLDDPSVIGRVEPEGTRGLADIDLKYD